MSGEGLQLLGLAWLTLVCLAIVAEVARGRLTGPGAQVATWIVMTGMTLSIGAVVAFVGCHVLLFALGPAAAGAGIGVSAVLLALAPIAWAFAIHRRGHPTTTVRPGSMQPRAHG